MFVLFHFFLRPILKFLFTTMRNRFITITRLQRKTLLSIIQSKMCFYFLLINTGRWLECLKEIHRPKWPASCMSDPHLNSETRRPPTVVKNPHLWKSCIFAPKSRKNAGNVSETLFFKIWRCLLPSALGSPYGDWWSVRVTSIAFTQTVCL